MDIFVNRKELIKSIFPMGTDDLGYTVRADNLYKVIMGMPEYTNMARYTPNKDVSAEEAIIALALARTKLSEIEKAMPIEALRLSVRTNNCLSYAKITTLGALMELDMDRLRRIRNLGSKGLAEIQLKVTEFSVARADG